MSVGDWPCTHCVRDLVMHPPQGPSFIRVTTSDGRVPKGYEAPARLTLAQFDEAFGSGWHVEIGNVGWRLGGYGNYLVAGTPLCYGHTWAATRPDVVTSATRRIDPRAAP